MADFDDEGGEQYDDERPAPPPIQAVRITVDEVVAAIKLLKDHKGSSRQSLLKYFRNKRELANEDPQGINLGIKKACDEGTKAGTLIQNKQSFKVKGVEFEPPKDLTVVSEVSMHACPKQLGLIPPLMPCG